MTVSYSILARNSTEVARNHLDFFAFTPHGYWHDIGHYENGIEKKWLDGFEVTKKRWPEVLEMVRRYDQAGKFVAVAGPTSIGLIPRFPR